MSCPPRVFGPHFRDAPGPALSHGRFSAPPRPTLHGSLRTRGVVATLVPSYEGEYEQGQGAKAGSWKDEDT